MPLNDLSDLRAASERTMQELSTSHDATLRVRLSDQEYQSEWSRDRFSVESKALIERLRNPVAVAMRDAGLSTNDLDAVILVGGASRMPLVRTLAAQMLGKLPLVNVNPDEVVALGAAVQAGLMQGDGALEELVLTDVAPYSLGVSTHNEHARDEGDLFFSPIIERNTPVPVSRVQTYYTVADNQRHISVQIYQGEALKVRDNIKLGELSLQVAPAPAGHQAFDLRFTYDIDGLLEVDATIRETGQTRTLVIERSGGSLSEKDIQKRLRELSHLKIHPRDQVANADAIARAERMYQEHHGELRQAIATLIQQFEHIMEAQDPRKIELARERFLARLDEIEQLPVF
ncbi:MAG: Hsp70 family protein [Pseudomonadota bacterium]